MGCVVGPTVEGTAAFRVMQAKDLPDRDALAVVSRSEPANWWDMASEMGIPRKVVLAKMKKLVKRGLVAGCACGCRGDFKVTEKGKEMLLA